MAARAAPPFAALLLRTHGSTARRRSFFGAGLLWRWSKPRKDFWSQRRWRADHQSNVSTVRFFVRVTLKRHDIVEHTLHHEPRGPPVVLMSDLVEFHPINRVYYINLNIRFHLWLVDRYMSPTRRSGRSRSLKVGGRYAHCCGQSFNSMTLAGLPGSSWAFAIRIWLAIVVALYVSFWLELEAPSSGAPTVAILALATRGQALEKAVFRLIATVLGVAASITIVGIFAQTGSLLLAAFAAWLGLCVYAVGLLDGNRAYAAALSGYTVAVIAVQRIDNPQHIFESGIERGVAITIGILAVTVVNDLLAAPDHHPHLAAQLGSLHHRVARYARRVLGGEAVPAKTAAALLGDVVALRPEINSLAAETFS